MTPAPRILCLVGPDGLRQNRRGPAPCRHARTLRTSRRRHQCRFPPGVPRFSHHHGPAHGRGKKVCPHKLYGWLETTKKISAGQWADLADAAIRETLAEGRLPILVGGTGFYLRALLDGGRPPFPPQIRK